MFWNTFLTCNNLDITNFGFVLLTNEPKKLSESYFVLYFAVHVTVCTTVQLEHQTFLCQFKCYFDVIYMQYAILLSE